MNVDIENSASKKQSFWRPIYEVIENSYFEETRLFPTFVLTNVEIIKKNLITYRIKLKQFFFNGYGTGVVCTSGYDPTKGVR